MAPFRPQVGVGTRKSLCGNSSVGRASASQAVRPGKRDCFPGFFFSAWTSNPLYYDCDGHLLDTPRFLVPPLLRGGRYYNGHLLDTWPGDPQRAAASARTSLLTTRSLVRVQSGEPNPTLCETLALWLTARGWKSRRTGVARRAVAVIPLFNRPAIGSLALHDSERAQALLPNRRVL